MTGNTGLAWASMFFFCVVSEGDAVRYQWIGSIVAIFLLLVLLPAGFAFFSHPTRGEPKSPDSYTDYHSQVGKALHFFVHRVYDPHGRRIRASVHDRYRDHQPHPYPPFELDQLPSRRWIRNETMPRGFSQSTDPERRWKWEGEGSPSRGGRRPLSPPENPPPEGGDPDREPRRGEGREDGFPGPEGIHKFRRPRSSHRVPRHARMGNLPGYEGRERVEHQDHGEREYAKHHEESPKRERYARQERREHAEQEERSRRQLEEHAKQERTQREERAKRERIRREEHEKRERTRREEHEKRERTRREEHEKQERTRREGHEKQGRASKQERVGRDTAEYKKQKNHRGRFHGGLSDKDFDLIARAVYAEARGEPYVGQVAVAAVILNRLESGDFPATVSGVIFQPRAFDAVVDGQIWLEPDEDAYRAVEDALLGWDPADKALYYYNPGRATSRWIRTRSPVKRIGRHVFCR
ncbi:cell wall hydrolase [Pasteuria penetrans]|uniref:cell wall hydrolase n=1 Tax=Pasteuria penetrans TaxID=86005 RepID=UPI000FBA6C0A